MGKTEEWRPVVGYEDLYEVSDCGRVRSLPRKGTKGGMLKTTPAKRGGYLQVGLSKNGEQETCRVHILVMRAFVGECPAGYEVDHYDWNPMNNMLENLSYQPKEVNRARRSPEGLKNTAEANMRKAQDQNWRKNHAEAMKKLAEDTEWQKKHAQGTRKACCKLVDQFTLDGQFVKRWPSATDVARELGLSKVNISKCCNGKCKSVKGFKWKFAQ